MTYLSTYELISRTWTFDWFNSIGGFVKIVEASIPNEDPISFDQVGTKFRSSKD